MCIDSETQETKHTEKKKLQEIIWSGSRRDEGVRRVRRETQVNMEDGQRAKERRLDRMA